MKPTLHRIAGLGCAAALVVAGYWSVRLAYADFFSRSLALGQLAAACRLAPGNAAYLLRWAALVEESGQPAPAAAESAASLEPYNSSIWIRQGLRAEGRGDLQSAERLLLHAAQVNRQYEPRWTLAGYYFRRGDASRFWFWVKSALAWSYGDRSPLFDLCWHFTSDSNLILREAIPDDAAVRREYLTYLFARNRMDAAEKVGRLIAAAAGSKDRDSLLWFTDRMLDIHHWDAALDGWNGLCARKLVPYPALHPDAASDFLTNGDFRFPPLSAGFDWRLPEVTGVTSVRTGSPVALRFVFSGSQPERCEVLQHYVPVLPAREYRLSFEYRTSDIGPGTGLRWQAFDGASGAELHAVSEDLSAPDWRQDSAAFGPPLFTGSERSRVAAVLRLALAYRRMPGTVRIEGTAWLRNVRLEVAP
jgi:hypothetical protein